jgi:short-subunit dehydrogenase
MPEVTLRGSHVVLTGASKGLGAALTRELTRRGARVTMIARPSAELDAVAGEVGATKLELDLSDFAGLAGTIDRAEELNGPVDVLINNAALVWLGSFRELDAGDMHTQLSTNLLAPMELARQAVPRMLERNRGVVVNVASLGANVSLPNVLCYSVSKTGLVKFTCDLQQELKGSPVRAVLVSLGAVGDTPMIKQFEDNPLTAGFVKRFKTFTSSPEDVARRMADCIGQEQREIVVIPAVARPLVSWSMVPTRLASRFIGS